MESTRRPRRTVKESKFIPTPLYPRDITPSLSGAKTTGTLCHWRHYSALHDVTKDRDNYPPTPLPGAPTGCKGAATRSASHQQKLAQPTTTIEVLNPGSRACYNIFHRHCNPITQISGQALWPSRHQPWGIQAEHYLTRHENPCRVSSGRYQMWRVLRRSGAVY